SRTPLNIRDYTSQDFLQLYEIDQAAFSEDIAYSRLELGMYLRSRKCRTLVAEEADRVVGFVIGCDEPRKLGHIITIDVAPHHQRKQIGSRLLAEIEHWLWQQARRRFISKHRWMTQARKGSTTSTAISYLNGWKVTTRAHSTRG